MGFTGSGPTFDLAASLAANNIQNASGDVTVTLMVTDNDNPAETDTTSVTVTLAGALQPPIAIIADPGTGTSLDGSESHDQDSVGNTSPTDPGITAYAWSYLYNDMGFTGSGPRSTSPPAWLLTAY